VMRIRDVLSRIRDTTSRISDPRSYVKGGSKNKHTVPFSCCLPVRFQKYLSFKSSLVL
jgi:hypothetical protein